MATTDDISAFCETLYRKAREESRAREQAANEDEEDDITLASIELDNSLHVVDALTMIMSFCIESADARVKELEQASVTENRHILPT